MLRPLGTKTFQQKEKKVKMSNQRSQEKALYS